jgi:phenylpropionate dioxygenase-like ring-hydroxylating dioxygenase large terminal subunit
MEPRFPFPSFPNGWFAVATSASLAPGGLQAVHALGRELVVFRAQSGVAHVVDAFCPHLGTHLGYGGRVIGETVRCPFHGWRFDGCGTCVEAPGANKIPPRARLDSPPVCERNGVIMVHHDLMGRPPAFEVPDAPELSGDGWTRPLEYSFPIRTHVQEICENLADVNHFAELHGLERPTVVRNELGEHTYNMTLDSEGNRVDMTLYGLGVELSRMQLRVADRGERLFAAKFMTPLDEERALLRVLVSAQRRGDDDPVAEQMAALFQDSTRRALQQDVPIWEHKRYQKAPLLTAVDAAIPPFRRWAQRFYQEIDSAVCRMTSRSV